MLEYQVSSTLHDSGRASTVALMAEIINNFIGTGEFCVFEGEVWRGGGGSWPCSLGQVARGLDILSVLVFAGGAMEFARDLKSGLVRSL
eukprot:441323-Lingulodinium_polyedra.AAC.1